MGDESSHQRLLARQPQQVRQVTLLHMHKLKFFNKIFIVLLRIRIRNNDSDPGSDFCFVQKIVVNKF